MVPKIEEIELPGLGVLLLLLQQGKATLPLASVLPICGQPLLQSCRGLRAQGIWVPRALQVGWAELLRICMPQLNVWDLTPSQADTWQGPPSSPLPVALSSQRRLWPG